MMKVKIDAFEGPLDLLLHLIQKAEVDIYDISVSEITDQYVAFIRDMQQFELDIASEFLVMASTLLSMKSKMLLPKPEVLFDESELEEELDPREELIRRLLEYKRYKDVADTLREQEVKRSLLYTRAADDLSPYMEQEEVNPVQNVSLFDLLDAFQLALKKTDEKPMTTVHRDEISIDDRMKEMLGYLREHGRIGFQTLFQQSRAKYDIVVTFLALLELMKNHQVRCVQFQLFDEIWITFMSEASNDEL